MIHIDTMELKFTKSTGTFCCPECEQERTYRLRSRWQFLTVYFIPLIPLQSIGQFVECSTCRGQFPTSTTGVTVDEFRARKRQAANELVRRALVVIVAADDMVTPEELAVVRDFARSNGLAAVTEEQVLREATSLRQAELHPLGFLRHVAEQLNEDDKDRLVYHAFLAATASGQLSAERQSLLARMPDAIGIPEMRFREIVLRAVNHR